MADNDDTEAGPHGVISFPKINTSTNWRSGFAPYWQMNKQTKTPEQMASFELLSEGSNARLFTYQVSVHGATRREFPFITAAATAKLAEGCGGHFNLSWKDCYEYLQKFRMGDVDPFRVLVATPSGTAITIHR